MCTRLTPPTASDYCTGADHTCRSIGHHSCVYTAQRQGFTHGPYLEAHLVEFLSRLLEYLLKTKIRNQLMR